ncbi:MAG: hypothetical protein Q4E67_05355 [Planctomycetia bacterium]|nr:hypothetical protein [Planctomycetia bacterium]
MKMMTDTSQKSMIPITVLKILLAGFLGMVGAGFSSLQAGEVSSEMVERLEQMERQTAALREELAVLKASKGFEEGTPVPETQNPTKLEKTIPAEEISATIEQEIQKAAWRKGETWIRPYGMVWAAVTAGDSRFLPNDAVIRALPDDAYGQSVCTVSVRRSRLGVDFSGPEMPFWGNPTMGGKVEIDFMGELGTAENKPSVLLRHAYWEMKNDCYRVLVGQTEDVISPLTPGMLNYYNGWFAGNIGYRNPQIQLARYFYPSDHVRMELQTAICQIYGSDFSSYDHPGSYPTVQARLGWTIARNDTDLYPIRFGISGHIGQQDYTMPIGGISRDLTITTWSVNVDWQVPITNRFGIQGEFFHGQGLSGLGGGVDQSLDYSFTRGGTLKSIHSTGGWVEVWWDWTEKLRWTVGYGKDDPLDSDMEGASIRENSVIYANCVYQFTPFLRTGLEYSYWKTLYAAGNPGGEQGKASVVEWMWQFEF